MTVDEFIAPLEGVRKQGGGWMARCPAHKDQHASLSVSEGDEGRLLVFCHAGCSVDDVLSAMRLEKRDLFQKTQSNKLERRVSASYDYLDEQGELLFQAVRFEPKGFAQRCRNGNGWEWRLGDTKRVLYRLPAVLEAAGAGGTVYLVEGEKDVHALEQVGLVATCNPMGAGKWRREYVESLRGAQRVVVFADDDEPGRKHAADVAGSLVGAVDDIRVVELWSDGDSGRDVTDWIGVSDDEADLEQARTLLTEIVEATPKFVSAAYSLKKAGGNEKEVPSFQPVAIETLLSTAPAEPAWHVRGYVAPFAVTLLAGRPKVGKSTYVFGLLSQLVVGQPFVGLETSPTGVLLLSEERRDTLAEKARIFHFQDSFPPGALPYSGGNEFRRPVHVQLRHDTQLPWPEIVRLAMRHCHEHDLQLLVVDTWDRWTSLRGDSENAAGAVNEALEPLQYAAASGLAVLIVSHQRKSSGEYGESVRGSNALTGGVDVIVELERPAPGMALGKQARVLRSVSRFTSTPDELYIELEDNGFAAIESPEAAAVDAERARVLAVLEQDDELTTAEKVAERVELPQSTVRRHLNTLYDRGLVSRTGEGRKGDPYVWQPATGEPTG